MSWLKAMNPNAPIHTEVEALRAARASAISIMIGVAVGVVGVASSFVRADDVAVQAVENADPATAAVLSLGMQVGFWIGIAMVVIQMGFAVVQWREPRKFIALLFIVLIVLGLIGVLASPLVASMTPNAAEMPMWEIVVSVVIMAIQITLHVAGLRGIAKLDALRMEAAR